MEVKKSLSADDWEYMRQQSQNMYFGKVKVRFDDFEVIWQLRHESATKGYIKTYVGGEIRGEWMSAKNECPQQQFLRRRERSLYKPSEKADYIKTFGKRRAKVMVDAKWVMFDPIFPSWAGVFRHIKKLAPQFANVELIRGES